MLLFLQIVFDRSLYIAFVLMGLTLAVSFGSLSNRAHDFCGVLVRNSEELRLGNESN